VPYGITECYLPPGRGDIPAFTPAKAGTRLSIPGGMQGCVDLGTAVKVQSPCPRLHIAVAIGINTTIGCEIRTQVLSYLSLSLDALTTQPLRSVRLAWSSAVLVNSTLQVCGVFSSLLALYSTSSATAADAVTPPCCCVIIATTAALCDRHTDAVSSLVV